MPIPPFFLTQVPATVKLHELALIDCPHTQLPLDSRDKRRSLEQGSHKLIQCLAEKRREKRKKITPKIFMKRHFFQHMHARMVYVFMGYHGNDTYKSWLIFCSHKLIDLFASSSWHNQNHEATNATLIGQNMETN